MNNCQLKNCVKDYWRHLENLLALLFAQIIKPQLLLPVFYKPFYNHHLSI